MYVGCFAVNVQHANILFEKRSTAALKGFNVNFRIITTTVINSRQYLSLLRPAGSSLYISLFGLHWWFLRTGPISHSHTLEKWESGKWSHRLEEMKHSQVQTSCGELWVVERGRTQTDVITIIISIKSLILFVFFCYFVLLHFMQGFYMCMIWVSWAWSKRRWLNSIVWISATHGAQS